MNTIKISEVFGPTIQGEGPSTGQHCLFVRVSRCNLHCVWCDTPYTWSTSEAKAEHHNLKTVYDRAEEEHEMSAEDILKKLNDLWDVKSKPTLIVISGGEPMLQQEQLTPLIQQLIIWGNRIEIETAGTLVPVAQWCDHPEVKFNCSPKLANSGNPLKLRRNVKALEQLEHLDANFKFVAEKVEDLEEIEELQTLVKIRDRHMWVMPEGITMEATLSHAREVVDEVLKKGWNFSMRTHIAIWGTARAK